MKTPMKSRSTIANRCLAFFKRSDTAVRPSLTRAIVEPLEDRIAPASIINISPVHSDNSDADAGSSGRINKLGSVAGNNQIFYAASEWGGLFKSTDGGDHWSRLNGEQEMALFDVKVDPSNANRVITTSFYDGRATSSLSGIEVSTDGGVTWTNPATAHPGAAFNANATAKQELSAFTLAFEPGASNNIYVGTNVGLAKSTDSGQTWTYLNINTGTVGSPVINSPGQPVFGVHVQTGGIIDIVARDGHHRSTDGGQTWTSNNLPSTGNGVPQVTSSPNESYVLFVTAVDNNLYESDDAGATWANKGNPNPQGRIPFAVTNDRASGFDLWFGDVSLYRAAGTDGVAMGGANRIPNSGSWTGGFTRSVGGHDDMGDLVFDNTVATDAPLALMASDGGVYRCNNGSVTSPTWTQPTVTPQALWVVSMSGVQGGGGAVNLYLGQQDTGDFVSNNAQNNTPTWHSQDCCDIYGVYADSNRVLYSNGFFMAAPNYHLTVGNTTWTSTSDLSGSQPGNMAGPFTPFPDKAGLGGNSYAIVTDTGVWMTADITAGPPTWTQIGAATTPAGASSINVAMSGGTPTLYVTTGGGNNSTSHQLWKFVGTGAGSWTEIDTNMLTDTAAAMSGGIGIYNVDPTDPNILYASNLAPGGVQMVASTDGGGTWHRNAALDAMMTKNAFFKYTTTRGPTDFTGFNGYVQPTFVTIDPADSNRVVAGGIDSGVFLTLDGGASWQQLDDPINGGVTPAPHIPRPYYGFFDDRTPGVSKIYVATQGRGVFRIDAAQSLPPGIQLVGGTLTLTGDQDFAGEDDVIRLVRDTTNPGALDIFINNNGPMANFVVNLSAITQINVNSLGGNDTLIMDSTKGLITVANGTRYDGGAQRDSLQLIQTGGSQTSDVYSVGLNNGDGSSAITGPGGLQLVQFQNIEPVFDNVVVPLTVNATAAANAINYAQGPGGGIFVGNTGKVTIDNFESIEFNNKTVLTINGLAGSDEISLHNDNLPTGLTGITVDGGDPTASDKLIVTGTSGADSFTFAPTSFTSGNVTGVVVPVHYSNAEHVVLDGQGGDDTFNLKGDTGAVSLLGGAGADRVSFSTATEGVVFNLDALNVEQRVTSSDATVTLLDHLEKFTGTPFNDVLRLQAATFAHDIDGGLPNTPPGTPANPVPPGDTLILDGQGAVVTVMKTTFNSGTIKTKGYADVTFSEFETISLTNTPSNGGFGPPGSNSNAFAAAHVYDQTTFTVGGKPAPGRGPQGIATGDFNGDGFADLVVANSKTRNISVFINKGDGTFLDPVNFAAGGAPQDVVTGDFNNDTKLDIAVTDHGSGDVALFIGTGGGVFAPPTFTKLGAAPGTMASADLNGDTFPDLVVALPSLGAVDVLLGTGAGGFGTPTRFKTGGRTPYDVAIGDFNNDTKLDVVTANYGSNNIGFLAGNGGGSFATATTSKTGVHPTGVAAGDINNDGVLDVAVSNQPGAFVSILLSNGVVAAASPFLPQLRVALPVHHAPFSIAIADLDGNGIADIILGNAINPSVTVLLGIGLGKFTQPYEFALGTFPKAPRTGGLTLVDLNNDGLLDIASTSTNTDDTRVFLRNV